MEAVCLFKTSVKNCELHVVLPQENVPFINGDFKISSHRRILLSKPSVLTSLCDIRSTHTCINLDTHGRSHATNHHLVQKRTYSCFDNWCTNKIITIIWNVSEMPKSIRFFLTLAYWNVMNKSFEMQWHLSNSKSMYVKQSSEQTIRHIVILHVHVATTFELPSSDIFTFYIASNVSSKN